MRKLVGFVFKFFFVGGGVRGREVLVFYVVLRVVEFGDFFIEVFYFVKVNGLVKKVEN